MDKSIIITGIGKGFGKELFKDLQKEKYYIIGITKSKEDKLKLMKLISNNSAEIHFFDITNTNKLKIFFSKLKKRKIKIWGLINNAGIRLKKDFFKITENEVIRALKVNAIAPLLLTQMVIPLMGKTGGRIINVSSIISDRSLPNLCGYAMSKNSLNSLTKSSALELSKLKITVNAIAPGFCQTSYFQNFLKDKVRSKFILNKIPMQRWGSSKEIVGLVSFLLSKKSDYMTGNIIPLDGGWSSW